MTSRGTKRKSISNEDDVSSVSTVGSKSKRRTTIKTSNSDGQNDSVAAQRQNAREWALKNLNMSNNFKSQLVKNEKTVNSNPSTGLQNITTSKKPSSPENEFPKIKSFHATSHIVAQPAPVTAIGNDKFFRKLSLDAEEPTRRNSLQDRFSKVDVIKGPSVPSLSANDKRTGRLSDISDLSSYRAPTVSSLSSGPFSRRADNQREEKSLIADFPLSQRYSATEPRQKASGWPTGDLNLPSPVVSPTQEKHIAPINDEAAEEKPTQSNRILPPGDDDNGDNDDDDLSLKTDVIKDLASSSSAASASAAPSSSSSSSAEPVSPALSLPSSSLETQYVPSLAAVRDRVLAPLVVALLLTAMLRSSDSRALAIGGIISALACSALRRLVRGMANFLSSVFGHGSGKEEE